jgi:hypothetical protein
MVNIITIWIDKSLIQLEYFLDMESFDKLTQKKMRVGV